MNVTAAAADVDLSQVAALGESLLTELGNLIPSIGVRRPVPGL
jgi:hypothetical protein